MNPGRNDPCLCGSGRKYKHCCLSKSGGTTVAQKIMYALIGIVLLVSLVLVFTFLRDYQPGASPQRVWSEEHQHWHTID